MEHQPKILLIEDEKVIIRFLTTILKAEGYGVVYTMSGKEGITLAASHGPELILLDLGLPDIDGMDVLEAIREWSDIPVIVVSARESEREKVRALDAGANDYITKPFGNSELLARIRSSIRLHAMQKNGAFKIQSRFSVNGLELDYIKRTVTVEGVIVRLTPIEYKILVLLSQNSGKVLTHDFIIKEVWGPFASDSQTLRVNMANIRRKIEDNPGDPRYILTEVGIGYRLIDMDS